MTDTRFNRHCEEPQATWQSSQRRTRLLRYARNGEQVLWALAPILLASSLTLIDKDFVYTLPLAVLATFFAMSFSYLHNTNGNWHIHGMFAGIAGFAVSIALILSISI